jgi:hypothetical protein
MKALFASQVNDAVAMVEKQGRPGKAFFAAYTQ